MTDKDLILKRISCQIQDCDKLIRGKVACPQRHVQYAKGEILGLVSLQEFIEASIPDEKEPMVRNCIFINNEPSEVYPAKNILTKNGLAMYGRFASDKIESRLIEIREVKNEND